MRKELLAVDNNDKRHIKIFGEFVDPKLRELVLNNIIEKLEEGKIIQKEVDLSIFGILGATPMVTPTILIRLSGLKESGFFNDYDTAELYDEVQKALYYLIQDEKGDRGSYGQLFGTIFFKTTCSLSGDMIDVEYFICISGVTLEDLKLYKKLVLDPNAMEKVFEYYEFEKQRQRKLKQEIRSSIKTIPSEELIKDLKNLFIPGRWRSLFKEQFIDIGCWLNFRGVYAIKDETEEKVVYIGRSLGVGIRAADHTGIFKELENQNHEWSIKIRKNKIPYEDLSLEARLINVLSPKYNTTYNSKK